ncbi:DUF5050 domain-containing protein [Paenibacillus aestuarii]|uniref:DUF5050 domain-containing protein n=1 Tax=Paenibacillus aestuarii TaxID=516965 RepID=A0ABW0KGC3_9BACL
MRSVIILGIKKIRTDGSGETSLFRVTATDSMSSAVEDSIHVLKDWIYFIQPDNGVHPAALNKIRKDGSQLTPLASSGNFNSFMIADGWIYYGANNLRNDSSPPEIEQLQLFQSPSWNVASTENG